MKDLGREQDYSWDKPAFIEPRVNLASHQNAKLLLENQRDFRPTVLAGDSHRVMSVDGVRPVVVGEGARGQLIEYAALVDIPLSVVTVITRLTTTPGT
jgi:hypothetical protein